MGSFVLAQDVYKQVKAGFSEAHSLPSIHSLMLMFDHIDCRPIFSGVKNILARLLSLFMSSCALPFVGKMVIFMCI